MKLGLGAGLVRAGGGVSIPFDYTSNTYWFDGTSSRNTIETTGDDTIAIAPNIIRSSEKLINTTKDYQLLQNTSGYGFEGQASDARSLSWDDGDVSGFANGHTGCYMAGNIYPISNDYLLFSNGRFTPYVPSNRQFGFKHSFDGGGNDWAFRGPAITLSQWITVEVLMNYTTDQATIWYNGVEQTLAYNNPNTEAFSASSIDQNASISAGEGITQQVIYHDALIATDSDIRTTISSYLTGIRP